MFDFERENMMTRMKDSRIEAILVTKIRESYIAVYQNEKGERMSGDMITAQEIFDFSKHKLSKKNDI